METHFIFLVFPLRHKLTFPFIINSLLNLLTEPLEAKARIKEKIQVPWHLRSTNLALVFLNSLSPSFEVGNLAQLPVVEVVLDMAVVVIVVEVEVG